MKKFKFQISIALCIVLILFASCIIPEKKIKKKELKYPATALKEPKLAYLTLEYNYKPKKYNNPEYQLPLRELPENYQRDIVEKLGRELSLKEKEILLNNGVVIILGNEHDRFEDAYLELKRKDVPIFITSDSILHLFHIEFNEILKNLEIKKLSPMLKEFLKAVLKESIEQYNNFKDPELKELSRRNIAYLSVALKLLDPSYEVPSFVKSEVEKEIKRIEEHKGFYKSEIFSKDCPKECLSLAFKPDESCSQAVKGRKIYYQGKYWDSSEFYKEICTGYCYCEDYSQYIPRGHYTQSDELKRYFKAMMWLGRMTFKLRGENWTKQAILLTAAVKNANATFEGKTTPAYELWRRIYTVTGFFSGVSEDLGFYEYDKAISKILGYEFNLSALTEGGKVTYSILYKVASREYLKNMNTSKECLDFFGMPKCKLISASLSGTRLDCTFMCTSEQLIDLLKQELKKEKYPKILSGFEIDIAGNLEELTKGLRAIGQRYALDSQILGDLVYKNVGPNVNSSYYEEVIDFCVRFGICSKPKEFYLSCENMEENKTKYWNEVCDAAIQYFCGIAGCSEQTPLEKIQKLYSVCRFMPSGLDVMQILGSEKAKQLLEKNNLTSYCSYEEKVSELKSLVSSYGQAEWNKNLYNTWLWMLQPVLREKEEGYPNWMRSEVWKLKDLITSLASWAELRHDTILYVKQSYTWAVGMRETTTALPTPLEARYYGYVEPNPELFARAKFAVDYLRKGLEEQGVITEEVNRSLARTSWLMDRLREISEKELEGKALDEEDYNFIQNMGLEFDSLLKDLASALTIESGKCPSLGICEVKTSLAGKEDAFKTSIIADVHTDANTKKVLEVGTGKIDWILVAHKAKDGRIGIAVGPIFSYYEFYWDMKDRLTDEKWRNEVLPRKERFRIIYEELK